MGDSLPVQQVLSREGYWVRLLLFSIIVIPFSKLEEKVTEFGLKKPYLQPGLVKIAAYLNQ